MLKDNETLMRFLMNSHDKVAYRPKLSLPCFKISNKYFPVHSSDQTQRETQQQSQILCRKTKGQEGLKDSVLCLGHHSIPS